MEEVKLSLRCDCGAGISFERYPPFGGPFQWQRILGTWRCPQCCEEKEEQDRVVDAKRQWQAVLTVAIDGPEWRDKFLSADVISLSWGEESQGDPICEYFDCRILKVETRKEESDG